MGKITLAGAGTFQSLSPEHVRKELRFMLISSICIMIFFVMIVPQNQRVIISDWLVNVCAGAVVLVSSKILYRQKFKGVYGRTYGAVAIGLLLWFSAEMITTYENYWATNSFAAPRGPIASGGSSVLQPSVADAIWLVGYGFFAYFLFRIMFHFSRSIKPRALILLGLVTVIVALILMQSITYYYGLGGPSGSTLPAAADDTSKNIMYRLSLFLHIEYPVLDLVLIVPAVVTLAGVKDGTLTSTPWLLLSAAVLILAVGDIGNVYSSVLHVTEGIWVWKMFATAAYLCIATSLFWYNRFFIFDPKRAFRIWQESNR